MNFVKLSGELLRRTPLLATTSKMTSFSLFADQKGWQPKKQFIWCGDKLGEGIQKIVRSCAVTYIRPKLHIRNCYYD